MTDNTESPINAALRVFEAAEANLEKLERLQNELTKLQPAGIAFGGDPKYDDLCFAYNDVLRALPPIDGCKPSSSPIDLDDLAQMRLDAREIDEIEAILSVERTLEAPGRELAEYRRRFNKKRRQVMRDSMLGVMAAVDELLRELRKDYPPETMDRSAKADEWVLDELRRHAREIEILLGSATPRPERWGDLRRHLKFGQSGDLMDVWSLDWPKVKASLNSTLYERNEPIPVPDIDLGTLAATQPTGTIVTSLSWGSLNPENFERLIYSLISGTPGYENAAWLTKTYAPDRGRDLSVIRVAHDQLGGVLRSRVIIQCKHWLTRSVAVADVAEVRAQMQFWEPPRVDVLVIATSGRFSSDAVSIIERQNSEDRALRIEMWPESHLERLLAERPSLVAEFSLR